jgi:hypothetical protein
MAAEDLSPASYPGSPVTNGLVGEVKAIADCISGALDPA